MTSKFIGSNTIYLIERVSHITNEVELMTYDNYLGTYRPVDNFAEAQGNKSFEYVNGIVIMNNQMEEMKVTFGMVPSIQYEYYVIQKDEVTYRVDKSGKKIEQTSDEIEEVVAEEEVPV